MDEIADRSAINCSVPCASGSFNVDCNYLCLESYVALLYFDVGFNYDVIYYVGNLREGSRRGSRERTIAQENALVHAF